MIVCGEDRIVGGIDVWGKTIKNISLEQQSVGSSRVDVAINHQVVLVLRDVVDHSEPHPDGSNVLHQ